MLNYFNQLNFREKNKELKDCILIKKSRFKNKLRILKNKKIVIVGCGSQGLNQGLNMRDSGLDVSYALKKSSILKKNISWVRAVNNNFVCDTYESLIPNADLVINLTPDKQHKDVIKKLQLLMKKNSVLGYSHGFNIVEMGTVIRPDITVIMVAPKCPGTEVREEYKRGFGVPALISVHKKNNIFKNGIEYAKAWAYSIGSHKAGVLYSSFSAEVKSDLMGEQTILCGLLQSSSIVYYEYLINQGYDKGYSGKFIQNGWEVMTESLKHGGITLMMDRLSNESKIKSYELSEYFKTIFKPLFRKHMDDILSGTFSKKMIRDWNNKDKKLLFWRKETKNSLFENSPNYNKKIQEKEYFERGIFMISILKSGIELAFETMLEAGICKESAYYESLHELPLIANTISRKKLFEMNLVISDTAEYGNYLFSNSAVPLLKNSISHLRNENLDEIRSCERIDNIVLKKINDKIYYHPVEKIGRKLRKYMKNMKKIQLN
ncbi:MAG: ketol-acid reductoisomerase [Buchnera aphidicola (Periphyllus lyropictus)]|uniref:ketol-acid reductoisomerase n=1 Tax=Buchnera aphidicola TaxID=9 RepID=UPI001EC8C431|nr:ketol-acid reductoisomerase [Buchnera aphidicola]NIH16837.1 ketol-acid reductoisomerase [Buchnera aphidicola (Periphyllus lyropictus)]USS94708.1 ketol-acid reductoisomerase [Buchnera aphidicola (Periphyllus lyropictus)]